MIRLSLIVLLSGCAVLNMRPPDSDRTRHPRCNTIDLLAGTDAVIASVAATVFLLGIANDVEDDTVLSASFGSVLIFGTSSVAGLTTSKSCRRAHLEHVTWREAQQKNRTLQELSAEEARTIRAVCKSQTSDACQALVSSYMARASAAWRGDEYEQAIRLLEKVFRVVPHPEILYARAEFLSGMSERSCRWSDIALCRTTTENALQAYRQYLLIGGTATGARLAKIELRTQELQRRLAQGPSSTTDDKADK